MIMSATEKDAAREWPKLVEKYVPMTPEEIKKVDPIIRDPKDQLLGSKGQYRPMTLERKPGMNIDPFDIDKTDPMFGNQYKQMTSEEIKKVDPIIRDPKDQLRFILAAKRKKGAMFTLKSPSGRHCTYSMARALLDDRIFVSVLTGSGYRYMGDIFNSSRYYHGTAGEARGTVADNPDAAKGFVWLFNWLMKGWDIGRQGAEFWHSGDCCCCGRKLTDPESIARGIGPVCLEKIS